MKVIYLFIMLLIFLMPLNSASKNFLVHYMKDGENLYNVCKKYKVSLNEIRKINKISDVDKVLKGTKIKIPVENKSSSSAAQKKSTAVQKTVNKNQAGKSKVSAVKNNKTETKSKTNTTVVRNDKKQILPKENSENQASSKYSDVTVKENKYFIDYQLPLKGNIIPFVTPHFRGIIVFSEENNNITSVDDGVVNYADNVSGYGLTVIIKHKNDMISSYSGFNTLNIKAGDIISKNQVIGTAGSISRYNKNGILFSVQYKEDNLRFDMEKQKFYK